jgi:hypothetical protein
VPEGPRRALLHPRGPGGGAGAAHALPRGEPAWRRAGQLGGVAGHGARAVARRRRRAQGELGDDARPGRRRALVHGRGGAGLRLPLTSLFLSSPLLTSPRLTSPHLTSPRHQVLAFACLDTRLVNLKVNARAFEGFASPVRPPPPLRCPSTVLGLWFAPLLPRSRPSATLSHRDHRFTTTVHLPLPGESCRG